MSRRSASRRQKARAHGGWLGKVAVGALLVALVVGLGGYIWVRGYLHSEGFRALLAAQADRALQVRGNLDALEWDGLAVESDGYSGTGEGMVRRIAVRNVHTEIGLGELRNGYWELKGTDIGRIEVELDLRDSEERAEPAIEVALAAQNIAKVKEETPGWLPSRVRFDASRIREIGVTAVLKEGAATLDGASLDAEPAAGSDAYRAELRGGEVRLPWQWAPSVRLESATLRYADGTVFLTSAKAGAYDRGRLEVSGEAQLAYGEVRLGGTLRGVRADEVLAESWSKRVSGELSSSYRYVRSKETGWRAEGTLQLDQGVLTALPVLDLLAAYSDTRRFRVLTLSEAYFDWSWTEERISLRKIVIASESLSRLEGRLEIIDGRLEGDFRLGIAPGTLARIPGAETEVFLRGEGGLLWAPVRISGTLEDPEEDLSRRLLEAAGSRLFEILPETGDRVLKFTRTVVGDLPADLVTSGTEQGQELLLKGLEEGRGVLENQRGKVKELDGLLDVLLGVPAPDLPIPELGGERRKDR